MPCLVGATIRNTYPALTIMTAFFVKDLIESGFVGYEYALSEAFGKILGGDFSSETLIEKLNCKYGVLNNYFKFHVAYTLTHPALDAAVDAVKKMIHTGEYPPIKTSRTFKDDEIKEVNVKVAQNAARLDVLVASHQFSAKFSIPYAVAAILSKGHTSFELFKEPYLSNKNVQDLQKKVNVAVDNHFKSRMANKRDG